MDQQSMFSLLLITKKLEKKPIGGRERLCKLNYKILQSLQENRLQLLELSDNKYKNLWSQTIGLTRGYIDGVNKRSIIETIKIIKNGHINRVFIDGSNLGALAYVIKKTLPEVEVITFFHNVEVRFFFGALLYSRNIKAIGVLIANYIAERMSVNFSDKIICLSSRDSKLLKRIYNRAASHISPISLDDQCPEYSERKSTNDDDFALFVGGAFYANESGIAWFAKKVAPRINIKTYVVGRGFNLSRDQLEIPGKLIVIGEVSSLKEWYLRAKFVIAPIFDGSGMKTKVAEALMYGKKVIGTKEAFSGYEDVAERIGWVCNDADEFVSAINIAQSTKRKNSPKELRDIYLKNYSFSSAAERFKQVISFPIEAKA